MEVARLLVQRGASCSACDKQGKLPLQCAPEYAKDALQDALQGGEVTRQDAGEGRRETGTHMGKSGGCCCGSGVLGRGRVGYSGIIKISDRLCRRSGVSISEVYFLATIEMQSGEVLTNV